MVRELPRRPCVYVLASRPGGVTYVGVTTDLARRVQEHREGRGSAFTAKYRIRQLIWYEWHDDIEEAIAGEKQIKRWGRWDKSKLIAEHNPQWKDLYSQLA